MLLAYTFSKHQSRDQTMIHSGELHLYRVDLRSLNHNDYEAVLSPDEQQRKASYYFERDQRRYASTRGLLRHALGGYLGIAARDVHFQYLERGKPVLHTAHESNIQFNLSHSGDLAYLVFALDVRIGVDVQAVEPLEHMEGVAQTVCTLQELYRWNTLPEQDQLHTLIRTWVRKEAVVKTSGAGMSFDLHKLDVQTQTPRWVSPLPGQRDPLANWRIVDLDAPDGYLAAVSMESPLHIEEQTFALP
jgi:4'-phosphopantetheinyl transferase